METPQHSTVSQPRFSPVQLARLLGIDEPTPEQASVIAAPLAVIAWAGSGKSETMASRLVWLVANGYVRPERVLGLTFTRKAAAELASRVRARLDALRRVGLVEPRMSRISLPHATSLSCVFWRLGRRTAWRRTKASTAFGANAPARSRSAARHPVGVH